MVDHTDTQVFDSKSRASTPALGVELTAENGNECQQFQHIVSFDDNVVVDSPLVQTQLEKLDFDTQMINDSDYFEDGGLQSISGCEKEVVLDSEDEGICGTKTVGADNVLLYGNASVGEQCSVGNKGCRVNVARTGEQKGLYTSSQEPGESSQANALEFVDQFLSLNKMDLTPEIGIKKTVWEKSLSASIRKGPQSLAKRMKFRKIPITIGGTFDWADSDQHGKDDVLSKRTKAPFEFAALGQIPVMGDHKAKHLNSKEGSSSGNEHEEKKELVNLQKEIAVSTHSDSGFLVHNPNETCRMEQVSKMNFKNSSAKEFNEDLHTESPDQQLEDTSTEADALDMIDVGFNTQVAAEAMEALSYAPFAGCTTLDADQGLPNTADDYLKGVIMGKARSEHASIQMSNFSGLGGFATKSKRRKRTARRSGKNFNNEEPDQKLAMLTKIWSGNFLTGEQSDCMNLANTNESSGRRSPRLVVQGQADGTVSRNKQQCENYTSLISVEQDEGELKKTSTIAQESWQSLAGDTLKRTNNQSDNPRDRVEDGITKFRRKRSRIVGDSTKVLSARGRWSELHLDSSAKARNDILNQKKQTCRMVTATTSCLKLDTWGHPKGKRTLGKVRSHSNGAINKHASLATVNEKEGNQCCMKSQRRAEDSSNASCYNKDMKGKPQSVYSSPPLYPLKKDPRKNFNKPGSAVNIANSESGSISKGMSPAEVDDINFPLFSNGAEKNHKFGVSSCKNLEAPRSGYTSTVNFAKGINAASSCHMPSKYQQKPFNKNLPKSSLLKELNRLGASESIPDFTFKDLRRRRDMARVRVLFSQHLDDVVIKQQNKISARLGISIATTPVDATHFIADRFVRTRNMLETIALGKPVVTHLWLESCGQASCLIDEKNYILRDAKKEKEIGFSMPVTFARANQLPLLKGRRVFITPGIKPNKEMIISLVKAVQGQVVEIGQISSVKDHNIQDNLFILACEEDHSICVPFLDKGVAAYSSELLLNGIVIQKMEFERHELFKDHVKRNQPQQKKSRKDGVCLKSSLK